jgi:putative acetyltransferase
MQALAHERAGGGGTARSARGRAHGKATVALVAAREHEIVGHVLFSPVTITSTAGMIAGLGLAPLAVVPPLQRRGIGSLLVRRGLAACRAGGHRFVVVLGHPDYYPRFGFVPARRFGVRSTYAVPDPVFMALELEAGALAGGGTARYQSEFDAL